MPVVKPAKAKGMPEADKSAVVAEPPMLLHILKTFLADVKVSSWRRCVTAMQVILAFTPMRYMHIQRSRPIARCKVWMVFWCFRNKRKDDSGARQGFR